MTTDEADTMNGTMNGRTATIDHAGPVIEPMLTPDEVAELLNVSKSTLCRLTKKNEIPHKRIGQRIVRCCRADIVAWMREKA